MKGVRTQLFMIIAVLIHEGLMQKIVDGPCPTVKTVRNFNLQRYLGRFYQYSLYLSVLSDYKCVESIYTRAGLRNVDVIIRGQNIETNATQEFHYNCKIIFGPNWNCIVPEKEKRGTNVNYQILDTDYDNYAVLFACQPNGENSHKETIWVTSRGREMDETNRKRAYKSIENNGFSTEDLVLTQQQDC